MQACKATAGQSIQNWDNHQWGHNHTKQSPQVWGATCNPSAVTPQQSPSAWLGSVRPTLLIDSRVSKNTMSKNRWHVCCRRRICWRPQVTGHGGRVEATLCRRAMCMNACNITDTYCYLNKMNKNLNISNAVSLSQKTLWQGHSWGSDVDDRKCLQDLTMCLKTSSAGPGGDAVISSAFKESMQHVCKLCRTTAQTFTLAEACLACWAIKNLPAITSMLAQPSRK